MLSDEGFEVRATADGREALSALDNWTPSIILLDLMMPGMDGWAFREHQRKRADAANVPVIVMSAARSLKTDVESIAPAAVLAKPFNLDDLLETIRRVLNTVQGQPSLA